MENIKTKKISKRQGRVRQIQRTSQQWDNLCKQAVVLYDQGMTYSFIAKQFDCSVETLRVKLKKRGLWEGFSTDQLQENARKKWDERCEKAVLLQEKGWSYYAIARNLNCKDSNLVQELKKRGLWQKREVIDASEKWDKLCKQALMLREQGMTYKLIAQQLQCGVGCLHIELKKRGLKKQVRSQNNSIRLKWDEVCEKAVPLYEQGIGYPDIAQQLNCHVTTLRKELKKRGLWKGLSAEQLRVQRVKNASEKWDGLCKQAVILHEKGMSYTEIGRKLGCPRAKLETELKRMGLWNGISIKQRKKNAKQRWDRLCEKAVILQEEGMSYKKIAKKLNCSDSVLVEELKKRGTWKGESAEQLLINSRLKWDKRCRHAVLLRKEGMSYSKIAKQIGCHETNILKELKKRGLWEGYSREQIKENAKKKWDALCEEAVHLHNQGMSYYRIAKYLHCADGKLVHELKKRNVWENKRVEQFYESVHEKWDALCERAVILYEQGFTYLEIAQQFGYHEHSLTKQLKQRGLWRGRTTEEYAEKWDELCKQVVTLREQGLKYHEIAKQFGQNQSTIIRKLQERGLWRGFTKEQIQENARKKWDPLCEQAAVLRKEQRWNYRQIALQLDCNEASLRKELKKRGLYRKFHKDIKQQDYI
ncbi:hypothetical protein [Bacillus toyonensis]|uniref:hypothetical protein n=1 Tax=Bacillus toyonensis TaxID=155322 RepID=UPI0015968093|nr:hypothetical protein [Bacillus toyonensis]